MTPVNPIAVLDAYVDGFPSQRMAAKRLGVSQPFLSQVLTGRRGFPAWLLEALGLTTVVVKVCTDTVGWEQVPPSLSRTQDPVAAVSVRGIGRVACGGSDMRQPPVCQGRGQ